jgi:hypothetical protein
MKYYGLINFIKRWREDIMAIKLGILTNMPTPYRNEMWKLYNQVEDVDLDFYYCVEKEKDRYWNVDNSDELSEIDY